MKKLEKIRISILFAILFLPVCVQATVIDFNDHQIGTIQTGDYYDQVTLHDFAIVNMIGGEVETLDSYDSSHFNLTNGSISVWLQGHNNSIIEMRGGFCGNVGLGESSVMHLSGGEWPTSSFISASDNSVLHIYGYGFYYDQYPHLHGYWADGSSFSIWIRGPGSTSHVVLHEIPEPATLSLFGLLILFLRKRGN